MRSSNGRFQGGLFGGFAFAILLGLPHAHATTSRITEMTPLVSEPDGEEASAPAAVSELHQAYAAPSVDLERPWNVSTPASATAFTLDRRHSQFNLDLGGFEHRLRINGLLLKASFGLLDSWSIGLGARYRANYGSSVYFDTKWNFANVDEWSFALHPWVLITYEHKEGVGRDAPIAGELIGSRALDDTKQLHFAFAAGRNKGTWADLYYSGAGVDTVAYRQTSTFSYRFARNHGALAWVAPEVVTEVSDFSWDRGSSHDEQRFTDVMLGVGYQYFEKGVGLEAGFEAGPTWTRYAYHSSQAYSYYGPEDWNYTSFTLFGRAQLTLLLSYRI